MSHPLLRPLLLIACTLCLTPLATAQDTSPIKDQHTIELARRGNHCTYTIIGQENPDTLRIRAGGKLTVRTVDRSNADKGFDATFTILRDPANNRPGVGQGHINRKLTSLNQPEKTFQIRTRGNSGEFSVHKITITSPVCDQINSLEDGNGPIRPPSGPVMRVED